jgi:hypothetical protein
VPAGTLNVGASYLPHAYTVEAIERLLGLHEDTDRSGHRDVTIVDLLSWAQDPGGDLTWQYVHRYDADSWMWRRGPLAPDSEAATILWDFLRAMKSMPLFEQAIVALTVMGFSEGEVAEVLGLGRKGQSRVSRILSGRPKRDTQGQVEKDENGYTVYTGGVARRLARHMNGER